MKTLHLDIQACAPSGDSPVLDRAESVDAKQRPISASVRPFVLETRVPCGLTSDLGSRSAYAGLAGAEYAAIAEGQDPATHLSIEWTGMGMWNRTPKFGPFDHFQRWRFAT